MSQQMRPLDPANIDDYIETTSRASRTQNDGDAHLVRALRGAYALPATSRTAVLERVHDQLRAEMSAPSSARADTRRFGSDSYAIEHPITPPRYRGSRPGARVRAAFGAIAAVLVVALFAGAFYAVTQGRLKRHGTGPTATTVSTPGPLGVWQDVSVSTANTGGKLDFDPGKGVAYSVAASTGALYACGSGHLWYSQDGGAHYSVFFPSLPSSFAALISGACTMRTVQGWPGLFITASGDHGGSSVLYAAPGDGSWQKLIVSGVARPAGGGGTQGQVVGAQILTDLFDSTNNESLTPAVQASGNWLYFATGTSGSYDVVGTQDFGQSWVDVSASETGNPCTHFAVSPNNYDFLACQPSSAGGITESVDGGKTWTSLGGGIGSNLYLVGMSDHTIYATYENPTYNHHVVTSNVKTGTWTDQGDVYAENIGGPDTVAPDGMIYIPVLDDKTATQLSVYTYSPGSHGLSQIVGFMAIPGGKGGIREFGGVWPNMAPAVYTIKALATTGPTSVYRLYLPSPGSASALSTPTATTPATATAIGDVPCTQAMGNPADIQPGGVGADNSTFVSRWGSQDGVAAGSSYYGPKTSQGIPEIQVSNGYLRAYELFYNVDQGHKMAPQDATVVIQSILPKDATAITQQQPTIDPQAGGEELQQLYCSAAYLAVAPPSGQTSTYPVPRNGVIRVTLRLGQVGNVELITFEPVQ